MRPYSYDLRIRIHSYSLTHTIREAAKVFLVSPNTVRLLRKLFIETGSLNPRVNSYEHPYLITIEGETYLRLLLSKEVDLTLEEIRQRYADAFGILVSIGTIYNTLERLNFSFKKKTFSDPKESPANVKEEYAEKLKAIDIDKRFYLDETGSCLNMTPLYGRSYQGERVYDKRPTNPGKRVNTVAILTNEGIKAKFDYTSSLTAETFIFYLATMVLPILTGGQTLIMDNHPVHRAIAVEEYLKNNNIKFLNTPIYSPKLNPIEEAFSKAKQYIKKKKARTVDILINVIKDALNSITPNDASGYFNHADQFLA